MRRLERDSCPSLLIPHSPFFPVLPTRSDSARPLSTHSASGQDSSPSFRFCLIDLILSVRFSPYQILSRGCGFCLRMPEREFSALAADFLATRPDSRFLIPVFARRGAVARPAGHLGMLTQPITLMCTRRILRATHFAIEVRSALRTVQSLLNGGSSHVRVPHRAGQLGDGSGARRFRPLLGSWPSFPSGFAHAPTFPPDSSASRRGLRGHSG